MTTDVQGVDGKSLRRGTRGRMARSLPRSVTDLESPSGDNVNDVERVRLASGEEVVFKPKAGEIDDAREGVPDDTFYKREAAASLVADILGFGDLVPQTTIRKVDGRIGSAQQYVPDAIPAEETDDPRGYGSPQASARAAVFDYIIGQMDRHSGNWLVTPDWKIVLIDNGFSFPTEYDWEDYDNREFLDHAAKNNLPMPDVHSLRGKWTQLFRVMRECGLEPEAIELVRQRYNAVASGMYRTVGDLPAFFGEEGSTLRDYADAPRARDMNSSSKPTSYSAEPTEYAINRVGTDREAGLRFLGNRVQRRLAPNKIIYRDPDGTVHISLHGTDVVSWHPDGGTTVRTGGWNTPTTRRTIQDYTGLPVSTRRGTLTIGGEPWNNLDNGAPNPHSHTQTHHIPGPAEEEPLPDTAASTREAFEKAIDENPLDGTAHGVYADFLDEQGHHDEADFHRQMMAVIPHVRTTNTAFSNRPALRSLLHHKLPLAVPPDKIPPDLRPGETSQWVVGRDPDSSFFDAGGRGYMPMDPTQWAADFDNGPVMRWGTPHNMMERLRQTHIVNRQRQREQPQDVQGVDGEEEPTQAARYSYAVQGADGIPYVEDAVGHEHAQDGRFTTKGRGGQAAVADDTPPADIPPKYRHVAKRAFDAAKRAAYEVALRMPDIVEVWTTIFDHPKDLEKLGYNPSFSGTAHRGHDALHQATGLSAHLASSIVVKILPKALAWAKGRLKGGRTDAARYAAVDPTHLAEALAEILNAAGASVGLAPIHESDVAAALQKWGALPEDVQGLDGAPVEYDDRDIQDDEGKPPTPREEVRPFEPPPTPKTAISARPAPAPPDQRPNMPPLDWKTEEHLQTMRNLRQRAPDVHGSVAFLVNDARPSEQARLFDYFGVNDHPDPVNEIARRVAAGDFRRASLPSPPDVPAAPPPVDKFAEKMRARVADVAARNPDYRDFAFEVGNIVNNLGRAEQKKFFDLHGVDPAAPSAMNDLAANVWRDALSPPDRAAPDGSRFHVDWGAYLQGMSPRQVEDLMLRFGIPADRGNPRLRLANALRQQELAANPPPITEADLPEFENPHFQEPTRNALTVADVSAVRPISAESGRNANETQKVTFANGTQAVFKPKLGESIGYRYGIPDGTLYRREAAASIVADVLGFDDLVPKTTVREVNGKIGSAQQFADNSREATKFPLNRQHDGIRDAARAAAFDYIIGHVDRHTGNWMLRQTPAEPQGKLVLIDNGFSFPVRHDEGDARNREFLDHASRAGLRLPDLRGVRGKWPEVEKAMRDMGLEQEAIDLARHRFDLVTSGRFRYVRDLPAFFGDAGKTLRDYMNKARI